MRRAGREKEREWGWGREGGREVVGREGEEGEGGWEGGRERKKDQVGVERGEPFFSFLVFFFPMSSAH